MVGKRRWPDGGSLRCTQATLGSLRVFPTWRVKWQNSFGPIGKRLLLGLSFFTCLLPSSSSNLQEELESAKIASGFLVGLLGMIAVGEEHLRNSDREVWNFSGRWLGLLRRQFFVFEVRRLDQLDDRIAEKVRVLAFPTLCGLLKGWLRHAPLQTLHSQQLIEIP